MAYFGTNDLREIERRAGEGDRDCEVFINAFSLNVAKYIASLATTVDGKVDVILLTGGTAASDRICGDIARRVGFVAPVVRYPGEHELASLAENGYNILSGKVEIRHYDKNAEKP